MTYHDIWDSLPSQEMESALHARSLHGQGAEPIPCDRVRALVAAAALRSEEAGSDQDQDPEYWEHMVY